MDQEFDSPFAHVPEPGAEHDPNEIVAYPVARGPLSRRGRNTAVAMLVLGVLVLSAVAGLLALLR
jgi:hypothetical protein